MPYRDDYNRRDRDRDRGGFRDRPFRDRDRDFRDRDRGDRGDFRDRDRDRPESVYSSKVRAGRRRTYFFDVRRTKGNDFFITLTESTKRFSGDGYERHKIFLYKEDFNRFITALEEVVNHVKTELMPDYDYDEFTRRAEEWEAAHANENEDDRGYDDEDDERRKGPRGRDDDDISW